METRPANIEGDGEVTTRDLVRNALRMRPDRIIIGECRGAEALDMLQAMNTGHEGSMTTIHANDTRDALSRLEMMVGMAGFDLPIWVIRRQIASAIHIIVQVARLPGGARKVMKISEITGMEGDIISMHDLFRLQADGRGRSRERPWATSMPRASNCAAWTRWRSPVFACRRSSSCRVSLMPEPLSAAPRPKAGARGCGKRL